MKRRGFLGGLSGAVGAALTGSFVVSNPTVLDNGLVVPGESRKSDLIVPAKEIQPIALSTAESVPKAATLLGRLRALEISGSVYSPVEAKIEMILASDPYPNPLFSAILRGRGEIEVYLVKRDG